MKTKVGQGVKHAAELLKQGKLVAIPTETVYGLAGNALSTDSLARIFEVKQRPTFDPLILHVEKLADLRKWVTHLPFTLEQLATSLMPGPLTLVLPKQAVVPDLATAGKSTVAIRIPDDPLTLELLAQVDFPLAAPSANPFMYVSPTSPGHVLNQLNGLIPYILDNGPTTVGVESTIITPDEKTGGIRVLRLGGTSIETLEAFNAMVSLQNSESVEANLAPGQLQRHYAPHTPIRMGLPRDYVKTYLPDQMGFLSFRESSPLLPAQNQWQLSSEGDLKVAAKNLFAALRHLDRPDLKVVIAEVFPERGLGRAINDRLQRAAAAG